MVHPFEASDQQDDIFQTIETKQVDSRKSNKELDPGSDIPGIQTEILENLQNERHHLEVNPIDSKKNNTKGPT